ncbi:hypothetical protein B0T18DRAFT_488653 [Schizothecium vesticola]|uniref:Uncharacterized protein n=1 Tax=Schizothecium vesticola TaxID=314040 RepID=A0AA40EUX7_9PEZI|nr:hypothetical protein B0T18DRAFT_488653 [Schizothecium vesticola]
MSTPAPLPLHQGQGRDNQDRAAHQKRQHHLNLFIHKLTNQPTTPLKPRRPHPSSGCTSDGFNISDTTPKEWHNVIRYLHQHDLDGLDEKIADRLRRLGQTLHQPGEVLFFVFVSHPADFLSEAMYHALRVLSKNKNFDLSAFGGYPGPF